MSINLSKTKTMKYFFTVLLCFGLFLNESSIAQTEGILAELLERKDQQTHKSITEVFTTEELHILRAHFARLNVNSSWVQAGPTNWIFGIENVNFNFGRFDATDPSTFEIIASSPISNFEGAGAINESGDTAYVLDNENNLYDLDVSTGTYTNLGKVAPPAGENFTGLEFDPTDGTLYALSTSGTQTSLSIIDVVLLTATLVGITGMVLGIALAINPAGFLFALDIDNDSIYQINKLTAIAVLIGFIGFDANFGQGMALNALTGIVLLAAFNNSIFDSELRSVDLVTGLTTLIAVIIIGVVAQFGWIGIPNPSLGVSDNALSGFNLYPNPTGDMLYLNAKDRIESVSFYNMQGQHVLYQPVDALASTVNLSYLAAGHYICNVTINGKTGNYKIIKQ